MARRRESTTLSLSCETKVLLDELTDGVRSRIDVPIHAGVIVDKMVQIVTLDEILDTILQEDPTPAREPEPEAARDG